MSTNSVRYVVDDVDAEIARLKAAGVTLRSRLVELYPPIRAQARL